MQASRCSSPENALLSGAATLVDPVEQSLRVRAECSVHQLSPGLHALGGLPHVFPSHEAAVSFMVDRMKHPTAPVPPPAPGCGVLV